MAGQTPTAAHVISEVQSWIDELGVREAFKIVGTLLCYSGPPKHFTEKYFAKYGTKSIRNHDRVCARSKQNESAYTLIDHTEICHRLNRYKGGDVYAFFNAIYGSQKDENGVSLYERYATEVMSFASAALMQVAEGDVETLVCGASLEGVFFKTELPVLMANLEVTSINGVDADRLRKIFFSGRKDAAYLTFRKICQGELALARRRIVEATSEAERKNLRIGYRMSRAFFIFERQDAINRGFIYASPSMDAPLPPAYQIHASHRQRHGARLH